MNQYFPKHKVIDDDIHSSVDVNGSNGNGNYKNNSHNRYQDEKTHLEPLQYSSHSNFPKQADSIPVMAPYSHLMKRPGKKEYMEKIFGFSKPEDAGINWTGKEKRNGSSISGVKIIDDDYHEALLSGNIDTEELCGSNNCVLTGHEKLKRKIYNAFSDYFPDFIMTKIKAEGPYSVYKSTVKSLLYDGVRFLVCITKRDNNQIGKRVKLSNLEWICFQTRFSLDDSEVTKFNLTEHQYARPMETILDDVIEMDRETEKSVIYNANKLPLTVEILKEKDHNDLSSRGTISSALEIFNTLVTFRE